MFAYSPFVDSGLFQECPKIVRDRKKKEKRWPCRESNSESSGLESDALPLRHKAVIGNSGCRKAFYTDVIGKSGGRKAFYIQTSHCMKRDAERGFLQNGILWRKGK